MKMNNGSKEGFLRAETCKNVRKTTGLTVEQIISMSAEEVDDFISAKSGRKIEVKALLDSRLQGRGSVLLGRLIRREDIERRLAGI